MRLVIVTGMSGSGKSVAIRLLEDIGYYCVDNLPPQFLAELCGFLERTGHPDVGVSIDARSETTLADLPALIGALRGAGHDVKVLFLTASTASLVQRFSETRRRHPLAPLRGPDGTELTLEESIAQERELLASFAVSAHVIDTGGLSPATLRNWVRNFVSSPPAELTLAFESFAFKYGVPVSADLVFDVRNLPNPFYDPTLRPLTGLDAPVAQFLQAAPIVERMAGDIARFLETWLPSYQEDHRHYVTVGIGCTGGQHRSVYMVETLARRLAACGHVLVRHRALNR
jgi:UPF0042 nucleotide-binding protein